MNVKIDYYKAFLTALIMIFVAAIVIFIASIVAHAEGFYTGIGGSWMIENLQDTNGFDDYTTHSTEGLDIKFGYHVSEEFAVELDFNCIPGIDTYHPTNDGTINVDSRIDTYMLALKYSPDFNTTFKPFAIAGFGGMYNKNRVTMDSVPGYWEEGIHDYCTKAGLGIDYYVTKNISSGVEVNYTWGLGDLQDVEYTNVIVGLAYHF